MMNAYSLLADLTAIFHGLYCVSVLILFAASSRIQTRVLGILLALQVTSLLFLFTVGCPLTLLEKYFRSLGKDEIYQGSFLGYYLNALTGELISPRLVHAVECLAPPLVVAGLLGCILLKKKHRQNLSS